MRALLSTIFILFSTFASGQLFINEVSADNKTIIFDDLGDSPDYIEIFNAGLGPVDLSNYYLSDDLDNLSKWGFPNMNIEAGQYLLVWASGSEDNSGDLHANFKLSADGESIYLSVTGGNISDQVSFPTLLEDQAFGRLPDGGGDLTVLPEPSPRTTNNSARAITFSHRGGYYDQSINLSVSSITGHQVKYTTDGSIPTSESADFPAELALEDKSSSPNIWSSIPTSPDPDRLSFHGWVAPESLIDKAHTLRFAAFDGLEQVSNTYTHTYFVADDIHEKYNLPVISIVTHGDYLFDDVQGIYVPGDELDPDNPEWTGNYFEKEEESERPVHIEYFQKDGDLGFAQNAGIRIHGGKTRHAAQKSLRFYARTEYGSKYFNYQLFPQKNHDKYKRFVLRTSMGAWGGPSVFKDALVHEMVEDLDFESQDHRPVIVFINGEYWGIQEIRDRSDERYLSYTTDIDTDSIKIADEWNHSYEGLKEYLDDHQPLDDQSYAYVSSKLDVSSFIDYQIAQMYFKNYDWPANNNQHWRPTTGDQKWRYLLYDCDATFGDYSYNMMEHNTDADPNHGWPSGAKFTYLFRSLLAHEPFVDRFITRYVELLETDFQPERLTAILDEFIEKYDADMPAHIQRWHFPDDLDTWHETLDENIRLFIVERPCYAIKHLEEYFDMDISFNCNGDPNNNAPEPTDKRVVLISNLINEKIELANTGDTSINGNLFVYSAAGTAITSSIDLDLAAQENFKIDASSWANGMYFMRWHGNQKTNIYKIIVQH